MDYTPTATTYMLNWSFGVADRDGPWRSRDAVLLITTDLPTLLTRLNALPPAVCRSKVLHRNSRGLVISQRRVGPAWLHAWRGVESLTRYTADEAFRCLFPFPAPDPDNAWAVAGHIAARAHFTAVAAGTQVLVWAPRWGYDGSRFFRNIVSRISLTESTVTD